MTPAYVTVDVFTSTRFAGNPLAVFPDARDLTEEAMQAIAAEFNYSEVTFVLPPDDPGNTARVRIFTPTSEVPFAGHPNVGTAFVLGRQTDIFGQPVGETLRFEEQAGLVEVRLLRRNGVVLGATIRAPQQLVVGREVADTFVARCASINSASLRLNTHPPRFVSVGLPFVVAEVDSLDTLAGAHPNVTVFAEAVGRLPERTPTDFSLFLYARDMQQPWAIRARMFAPLDNVMEDPATGSASAALGAYLVSLLPEADCDIGLTIHQGVEMGRPSFIDIHVRKSAGYVTDVEISGRCVEVMQGRITL
jgi:trans-2,3-dihydro-3-hydroxyanthranilate isomerase